MKLSFRKRFNPDGIVFRQAVSITPRELETLQNAIQAEIAMKYPYKDEYEYTNGEAEAFLKPLRQENNIVYLKSTQMRFCNRFLKLKLKDYNTVLLIKK